MLFTYVVFVFLSVNLLDHCSETIYVDDTGYVDLVDDGSRLVNCNVTLKCADDYTISIRLFVSMTQLSMTARCDFILCHIRVIYYIMYLLFTGSVLPSMHSVRFSDNFHFGFFSSISHFQSHSSSLRSEAAH